MHNTLHVPARHQFSIINAVDIVRKKKFVKIIMGKNIQSDSYLIHVYVPII